jgi:hypothetical protein
MTNMNNNGSEYHISSLTMNNMNNNNSINSNSPARVTLQSYNYANNFMLPMYNNSNNHTYGNAQQNNQQGKKYLYHFY